MRYDEAYQRNIGLFTPDQQDMLRQAKVVVGGMGGVGGIQAVTLARLGLGSISIIDPGVFDPPDMNRQYGATKKTMDRNKAIVMGELLKEINPFMDVQAIDHGLLEDSGLEKVMEGSTLVVDAIDSCAYDYKVAFAKVARKLGVYNLSGPLFGFGVKLWVFHPEGLHFEEFCPYSPEMDDSLPSNAAAASLNGAMLAMEAALIITGIKKESQIYRVPDFTYIDLLTGKNEICNPFM
jgi:molybdopterin/thiamine biosynthesis adenylyltransferase